MQAPQPAIYTHHNSALMTRAMVRRAAKMQIGVLTGGGDCGGLNAAIRAVVIRAARGGHTVVGVADGWAGMLEGRGTELSPKDVAGIVGLGGTILGSSRTNPAKKAEDMERVRANFAYLGIDALI